jgi:hypothetical protein
MAKIPAGEQFGNVVAEPQRAVSAPRGAFGETVSQAVAVVGDNMLAKAEAEERRLAIEKRQEEREALAQRKASERAAALNKQLAGADNLQALHDDFTENVKAGRVPKDQVDAEWQRQSTELLGSAMEDVPDEHRPSVQTALQDKVRNLSRGVRKAVVARDQTETLSSLNGTLEQTSRAYLKDPAGAQKLTDEVLNNLGPAAGLTTEQIRAAGQRWKESTRFNMASTLVNGARRDNKALDAVAARLNGDEFADLDPQRRTTLLAQVEGFRVSNITAAEAAARRAEAHAERTLRNAEAEFNAGRTLVMEGKMPSQEWVSSAMAKMAGTPYAAAFGQLVKSAGTNAAFGSQPVAVMDSTINGLRAQLNSAGTDPKTEKQLRELEQIRDAARRDYSEDPLPAALERGILAQIAPLDVRSIGAATAGLAARVEQAQVVSTRVGAPVSPLLRAEAEQVSKLIAALPVEQRSTAIAELSQAAGPRMASAIGRQIASKDKALGLAIAMGGSKTTSGRHASELVLRGAQALKDRAVKEDNAALTGVRAQVAAQIGDAVAGEAREQLIEASVLTYYGMGSEGDADLGRAVRLATGGVTERGGRKVLLPYGLPEADFDRKLRALTPDAIKVPEVYIDGKPMPAAEFMKKVPDAALVTVGDGRYQVRAGRSLATDKDGRPVTLEVR